MDPEASSPSFLKKYKFTLISLFIIVLAAIPLLLLSNSASNKHMAAPISPTVIPSPTVAPMTTSNVEPTLTQVDTNMQATLNQVDTDIKAANSIDTSQDSTNGL